MAFVVQMDSNFNGLKSDLNGYSDAINNAQMKILEVIESDLNGFSAVNLGGWNDQLAQNLTTYCNDVKSGLTNVQSDVSGVCNCFNAILSDLSSGLTDCQKYRSRINNYSDRLRFINDDTKREKIVAALNAEQRNLSNCVSYCNSLVSQFSQYEFNGTINSYSSSTPPDEEIASDASLEGGDGSGEWGDTGGADGRHYTSKEAAIQYLLNNANGAFTDRASAEAEVDRLIQNGSIFIQPASEGTSSTPESTTTPASSGTVSPSPKSTPTPTTKTTDITTTGGFIESMPIGHKVSVELGGDAGTIYRLGPESYKVVNEKYGTEAYYTSLLDATAGVTYVDRETVTPYGATESPTLDPGYKGTWEAYSGKMQNDTHHTGDRSNVDTYEYNPPETTTTSSPPQHTSGITQSSFQRLNDGKLHTVYDSSGNPQNIVVDNDLVFFYSADGS